MAEYLMLDDLKLFMGSSWKQEQEEKAAKLISYATALLRKSFRDRGLGLEEAVATGSLDPLLLEQVLAAMVTRSLVSADLPLAGDFTNLTQAAGGYSLSVATGEQSLYLRKQEAKLLGLGAITVSSVDLFTEKEVKL